MKNLVNFFTEIGKLKNMPRQGWVIRNIKNPESIAEHTFRAAIMAWFLGAEKNYNFNIEKIIKMALIHDLYLCEIHTGDITFYDSVLPRDKKKLQELVKTWPRFSNEKRKILVEQKFKKEKQVLDKIIKNLPPKLKDEVNNLWMDYQKGLSKEGRFFKQINKLENFLQALEYWKKYKKPLQDSWWKSAGEFFDDPYLLEFIENMNKKFHKNHKPKN